MQRRSFIEMFVAGTAGFVGMPEFSIIDDEKTKWKKIRKQFLDGSSTVLNLNNGSAGMVPKAVSQQLYQFSKVLESKAPYEAHADWEHIKKLSKQSLAKMIEATEDEIAVVRNTTEALNYVLRGINIPKNSTVVCGLHDYGHSINILERLSDENGFNLKMVDVLLPISNDRLIETYKEIIDEDCSLVLLTAMTHREGQILPIKEITKIAKKQGALVVVDAAHAIGHFEHSIKDWGCDYYCTSLHKWLSCPIGCGVLYMKKDLIEKTKGSYSAERVLDSKMAKFEDVGTKPFAIEASILSAIRFQESIGLKTKNLRLKALTDYWVEGMKDVPNVTTFKPDEYGAVCALHYPGKSTNIMAQLANKNIHIKKVSALNYTKKHKVKYRISPNIYHNFDDLDRLIDAFKTIQISK